MSKDAFDKIAEGLNEALAATRGEGEVMEDAVDWKITSGLSKPTYEQLEAFCAQLADENARLRKEVSLAGGCAAIEYNGVKVIVSPDTPPILVDETGVRFMGLGYAQDNGEV